MLVGLGEALSDGKSAETNGGGEGLQIGRDAIEAVASAGRCSMFKVAVCMLGSLLIIMCVSIAVWLRAKSAILERKKIESKRNEVEEGKMPGQKHRRPRKQLQTQQDQALVL